MNRKETYFCLVLGQIAAFYLALGPCGEYLLDHSFLVQILAYMFGLGKVAWQNQLAGKIKCL